MVNRPGLIYVIQGEYSGLIKIGFSTDVFEGSRIKGYLTQNSEPIRICGVVEGTRQREREFHEWFEEERHHGEWFKPSRRVIRFVNRVSDVSLKYMRKTFDMVPQRPRGKR